MQIRTLNEKKNSELKGKVIRNMTIARKLLNRIDDEPSNSLRVIDCKPDKTDPRHQRTVLVFEDNDKFQEVFSDILSENEELRRNRVGDKEDKAEIDDLKRQIEELKKLVEVKG